MRRNADRRCFALTLRAAVALLPSLAAAGCGLLSQAPDRPLYRVEARLTAAANLPHVPVQLMIASPAASGGIDTHRIALARTPQSLDYYADAEWIDRVPFLVQAALVQGFEKSRAFDAVGGADLGVRADFVLDTTVDDFEAVYDSQTSPPRVLVRLSVALLAMPDRKIVAQTTISGEETAAANKIPDIVNAFDGALGKAIDRVLAWSAGNPALSGGRQGVSRTRFVR
jgi:cholesterol transport system auxiliary component